MRNLLLISTMLFCLWSYAQSDELSGEYEKKSATSTIILKLHPNGAFQFDSYSRGFGGLPAEPSISGRGIWSAENGVISFSTNSDTDIDYNFPLNLSDTQAVIKNESTKNVVNGKAIKKLEFFDSGIFWINGMELRKRNE